MNDENVLARKLHAWIERDDRRGVPLGHPAGENVGDHFSGEMKRSGDAGQIVGDHVRTEHRREVQYRTALRLRHFGVGHRRVGSAKINSLFLELANSAAGANRLIVDLYARSRGVVGKPFRVDRVWECCAGAVEGHSATSC